MKPVFHPRLLNDPTGDPGLLVQFMFADRAMLFDLGTLTHIPNSLLLKTTHVFVSHTHIDHFIGFDHLLRVSFGRAKTLHLYGPRHFIENVAGKLAGFTWNLVDRYDESITLRVTEVTEDRLVTAEFRAIDRFTKGGETAAPFTGNLLLEEPGLTVHAAILEHRVPCLCFALKEKYHINVRGERLAAGSYVPGPWINKLKQAVYEGAPDDTVMQVPIAAGGAMRMEPRSLGGLREDLLLVAPGQKIVYVTDTVFIEENIRRIVELARDADSFFCESPFLAEEEERGRMRRHLTTRQAGTLARLAGVKHLEIFHFSARHTARTAQMYREAEAAFRG